MDITIYLPDALGERAKAAGLPLSRLLRAAVEEELQRSDAVNATLDNPETYEVTIEDKDGRIYTGRITGKEIAYDDRAEVTVYLTTDERVLCYDGNRSKYFYIEDPVSELADLGPAVYAQACEALGVRAVVDL